MSSHRRLRQFGIALALAGALGFAAHPAAARVPGGRESRVVQAEPGLFQRVWHWLAAVAAERATINPWGSAVTPTTDSRMAIDPDGSPAVIPTTDTWTGSDPDGAH